MANIELKTYEQTCNEIKTSFNIYNNSIADEGSGTFLSTLLNNIIEFMYDRQQPMIPCFPPTVSVAIYGYPDGNISPIQPSPGQLFDHKHKDPVNGEDVIDTYQWDYSNNQWIHISHVFKAMQGLDFVPIQFEIGDVSSMKCECGTEATGSNKHSSWCQKYKADV